MISLGKRDMTANPARLPAGTYVLRIEAMSR